MKRIAPGTLCMIVDRRGDVIPSAIGKTTTVRSDSGVVCSCGCSLYDIDPLYVPEFGCPVDLACGHCLQPILPPGVDTSEPIIHLLPEPVV